MHVIYYCHGPAVAEEDLECSVKMVGWHGEHAQEDSSRYTTGRKTASSTIETELFRFLRFILPRQRKNQI